MGQLVPPEIGYKKPPKQERQFAADTAERTGQDKATINRHVSRAEALGDDLEAVTGTSLDKGVELDALKKLTPEDRKLLIERAQAGEQVSARQEPSSEGQKASSEFAEKTQESAGWLTDKADKRGFVSSVSASPSAFGENRILCRVESSKPQPLPLPGEKSLPTGP